jgi:phosphate-selective porin
VFHGGLGPWEFVGRFTYTDLDDGPVAGGKFWRFTPMTNWYLSGNFFLLDTVPLRASAQPQKGPKAGLPLPPIRSQL